MTGFAPDRHLTSCALAMYVISSPQAGSSVEMNVAHQMAQAHEVAFEQANKALHERDPKIELKRLQITARVMGAAQDAATTLQKLKTGGTQKAVVQHVHVEAGGQAVVGNVQSGRKFEVD